VTFPFTGIGACFWAATVRRELTGILGALAMRADHNTPINGYLWECLSRHKNTPQKAHIGEPIFWLT
jgi:hypothetical protein